MGCLTAWARMVEEGALRPVGTHPLASTASLGAMRRALD